jgi:predicted dehydrogenase
MATTLNWGILGAGTIARTFAQGVAHAGAATGRVVAVASRSQSKADAFGRELGIAGRYGSYEQLLADPHVQAVYVATPHPQHAEWAVKAAEAKKHVLCEKPIGMNLAEARRIVDSARANDVFLMEAFMYRCHPQTRRIVELVREKAIGKVKMIQAAFGFREPFAPGHRLWSNALGGGGILDVGCYPVSFSRLIAGAAIGKDFADPIKVCGAGKLHDVSGVDEYAIASLQFESGIVASVSTGVGLEQENVARIYGTEGWIVVPEPWVPGREGQPSHLIVRRHGKGEGEITIEPGQWLYALEAQTVAANVERRQAPSPAMSWDDTLGNMKTLDEWRAAIGLAYESERTK